VVSNPLSLLRPSQGIPSPALLDNGEFGISLPASLRGSGCLQEALTGTSVWRAKLCGSLRTDQPRTSPPVYLSVWCNALWSSSGWDCCPLTAYAWWGRVSPV